MTDYEHYDGDPDGADMAEAVSNAIQEILNATGGGFIEGLVGMVEWADQHGQHRFTTFAPPNQLSTRSLSMSQYLHA